MLQYLMAYPFLTLKQKVLLYNLDISRMHKVNRVISIQSDCHFSHVLMTDVMDYITIFIYRLIKQISYPVTIFE